MGICAELRGGQLGRAGRKPGLILKVTFSAGDVAAPARSPKQPRRAGQDGEVLQVAVAVQHVDDGQDDIEQVFKELEHGSGWRDLRLKGIRQQRLPIPRTRGMNRAAINCCCSSPPLESELSEESVMNKKLTWIGIAITAAYLVAAALLGWGEWDKFSGMDPNEVGDFLAGVVGPLALLWLILGYFQQGEELRLSTEALRQQAEELKQSVEHQGSLVEVARKQVEVQIETFKREQQRARDAFRPNFYLDVVQSVVSPESTYVDFELRNFGYRATKIVIFFTAPEHFKDVFAERELGQHEKVKFTVDQLSADDVGEHTLEIEYTDGTNARGTLVYPLTIGLDMFGIVVTLGDSYTPESAPCS
jgi:hypothetical protein